MDYACCRQRARNFTNTVQNKGMLPVWVCYTMTLHFSMLTAAAHTTHHDDLHLLHTVYDYETRQNYNTTHHLCMIRLRKLYARIINHVRLLFTAVVLVAAVQVSRAIAIGCQPKTQYTRQVKSIMDLPVSLSFTVAYLP